MYRLVKGIPKQAGPYIVSAFTGLSC